MENESKTDAALRNAPGAPNKKTVQKRRTSVVKLKGFYKQVGGSLVIRAMTSEEAANKFGPVVKVLSVSALQKALDNGSFRNLMGTFQEITLDAHRFKKSNNKDKFGKVDRNTIKGARNSEDKLDLKSAVARVGAVPGKIVEADAAYSILSQIAQDATDLFASAEAASSYLENANFDGEGNNALRLIEAGRTASVIARLDELRYGSQG